MRERAFLFRHGARGPQPRDRGKRELLLLGVLTGCLAESRRRLLHIQDVVDDLEGQADVLAITRQSGILPFAGTGVDSTEAKTGAEQRSRLGAVDGLEELGVGR